MSKKIVTWSFCLAIIIGVFFISYYFAIDFNKNNNNVLTKKSNDISIKKNNDDSSESSTTLSSDIISPEATVRFVAKENDNGNEVTLATIELKKLDVSTKTQLEKLYSKGAFKIEKCTKDEVVLLKQNVSYLKGKYYIGIDQGNLAIYKIDDSGKRTKEEFSETKSIQSLIKKSGEISFVNDVLNDNVYFDTRDDAETRLGDYN